MKTIVVKSTYNLKSVETYEGETIETKVARIVQEKAPITDGAPIIYTDREQGVLPAYNVRTDRWDIAENAMDKVNAAKMAKRDNNFGENVCRKNNFLEGLCLVVGFPIASRVLAMGGFRITKVELRNEAK